MTDEPSASKLCTKCGETKPLDAFSKHKNGKYGRKNQCKMCDKAYYKANSETIRARVNAYYHNNREKVDEYRRANADVILERMRAYYRANIEAFRARKKRWTANNKEHISKYNQAYLAAHRDRLRDYLRNLRRANPDRHRNTNHHYRVGKKNNGGKRISHQELKAMRLAQVGICAYCLYHYVPDLTIDHIIPINRGGKHEASNIVFACQRCNFTKQDKLLSEWVKRWYWCEPESYESWFIRRQSADETIQRKIE